MRRIHLLTGLCLFLAGGIACAQEFDPPTVEPNEDSDQVSEIESVADNLRELLRSPYRGEIWRVSLAGNEIHIEHIDRVGFVTHQANGPAVFSEEEAAQAEAELKKTLHYAPCRYTLLFAKPMSLSQYSQESLSNEVHSKARLVGTVAFSV